MEVSCDAVTGTNQKSTSLWTRVKRVYDISVEGTGLPERNAESLKGRWRRILPAVNKWVGCFDQAFRRKRSGQNDDDVVRQAHVIYERTHGPSKFLYFDAWVMLRRYPKWESVISGANAVRVDWESPELHDENSPQSGSLGKRKSTDGSRTQSPSDAEEPMPESSTRPEGVKKAKKKAKSALRPERDTDVRELAQQMRYTAQVREDGFSKQEELAERNFQRHLIKNKLDMLHSLMRKDNPTEKDQKVIDKLLAWAEENEYV